jgi:heme-degrading monooxygenase HmoA
MYARVWKFNILPGKAEEFAAAINSFIPILRRQAGFRSVLVLRGGPGEKLEATGVSAWDSLEALRNSETKAYQETLDRVLSCCEHRPFMREEEVLLSEFASQDLSDTATNY